VGNEADEWASLEAHSKEISPKRDRSSYDKLQNRNNALDRRALTDAAKDVSCVDCGVKYPPYVMDFDHVRGEKIKDVSDMIQKHTPMSELHAEIAKCEVVCANCHRIRTHLR